PADVSIIYLDRLAIGHDDTDVSSLAGRLPVLSTAPGQVMLAFSPPYIQDHYLIRADKDPGVSSRQLTRTDLEPRLAEVTHDGGVHVAESLSAGSSGAAAAIVGQRDRVVGGMSVVGPIDEINFNVHLPVFLAAARGLSQVKAHQSEELQDFVQ